MESDNKLKRSRIPWPIGELQNTTSILQIFLFTWTQVSRKYCLPYGMFQIQLEEIEKSRMADDRYK